MANYELMMILNVNAGEDALTAKTKEITKLLKDSGAKITKEDVWGDKKLAYKIKGSERGYYILLEMELDGKIIKTINSQFNLDGDIWRYMFVNLED